LEVSCVHLYGGLLCTLLLINEGFIFSLKKKKKKKIVDRDQIT
jgi:hypothetical protein